MIEQILIITGAGIIGLLGLVHWIYTFYTNKFQPYHSEVKSAMQASSPVLTKETSIWNAWIGFNASHSLGALIVAAVYIPLALEHIQVIHSNLWLSVLPSLIGLTYFYLAKKYWFKIPVIGLLLASLCFISALVLSLLAGN